MSLSHLFRLNYEKKSEKRRVIMIEYAIKIHFNNERKGKVHLYFSLDFTEFI